MRKLLYIDDEEDNLFTLEVALGKWFEVITLESPLGALELIDKEGIKVMITDQRMPQMTGLELAKKVQENFPSVITIILTAYDDNETVLKAINQGGIYRYLLKPWDIQDLRQTLDSAFESYELRKKNIGLINDLLQQNKKLQRAYREIYTLKNSLEEENIQLKEEFAEGLLSSEIIGNSKQIKRVLREVDQVAKTGSTVLLLGETGTGKELFAKVIHALSPRKNKLMVKINCAAIPETLIESELFGHEKGAFTGADKLKYGKIELAHQGTLFLDEIGELPTNMQPKLLRVLQENEFERVGGYKTIKADFRLVAATNRNLELEIDEGRFRSDLFFRLNILPITIPPLREHAEDIPVLVNHFVSLLNRKTGKTVDAIPKKTMDLLQEYHWPGNVRELENIIERAHVLSVGRKLEVGSWFNPSKTKLNNNPPMLSLYELEKQHIERTLEHTKWRVRGKNGAADILQVNPTTLESRMKKLGIERPH
ncbi:MAG TPA: sigma-54 dependent transcriptional regulator [Tenuifilaceae bacterium]|nr:sigma-54 dependent transcriptional regulator [Tenuifilaceae bacterium]HPE19329.1 sigma-54 dependent transcriptional regulator [Tenuifilaceae bacterium]HPQ35344.1 sigma-54 dependent transcriptional regulator [Tenuifilaceae bacterium]HRX69126.1 sigma-54 dependent transcriptional regulator [Tenuifilaceae bacterium]